MHRFLGRQVLIAAVLGVFFALLLGPLCSVFKPIASVFGMLLQMVVLPYICFSIIHGLGSILPAMALRVLKSGWIFFLALWILAFGVVFLAIFLIPHTSPVIIGALAEEPINIPETLLTYLIPENPFYDLANNLLSPIAIFGMILGSALMLIERKESFCALLETLIKVFEKILEWLAFIAPIGIFAQIAVSFGTISFNMLDEFGFYILASICISLFTALVLLPLLLSSLTKMSYRQVLRVIYRICLLPFATGYVALMVPMLLAYLKEESASIPRTDVSLRVAIHGKKFHEMGQVILPISYSFGQIGNCLVLLFVFFISFYYRQNLESSEYSFVSSIALPLIIISFSDPLKVVSLILSHTHFPEGAFLFFSETTLVVVYFQALMSSASILVFILLTIHAYYGLLKMQWKKLARRVGIALGAGVLLIAALKPLMSFHDHYKTLFSDLDIAYVIEKPVEAVVFTDALESPPREEPDAPLANILKTGILKVGYGNGDIPFCYFNRRGELNGYDPSFMYELGRDLDCKIEFIPLRFSHIAQELNEGLYDIGISSIIMTEERIAEMDFTQPYDEEDNVLVIPLDQKDDFLDLETVESVPDLKIGVRGAYFNLLKRYFPQAEAVKLSAPLQPSSFSAIDACLWSKRSSLIWCLMNPGFVVIDYQGRIGKTYLSFPLHANTQQFSSFLNNWLLLKKLSGFEDEMRRYWFEGESSKIVEPRWSILRNWMQIE